MKTPSKYWLFILPHVYVSWQKDTRILLYNTNNGKYLETDNTEIIALVNQMHIKTNLGCIECDETSVSPTNKLFINRAIEKGIFETKDYSTIERRPIQLMPILNIQKDIEKIRKSDDRSIGENNLQYLREITLYLNASCSLSCSHCKDIYRQVPYCTQFAEKADMELATLESIATQIRKASLGKLHLIGGDIFQFPHLKKALDLLSCHREIIHCWTYYRNWKVAEISAQFEIWVDYPLDEKVFDHCILSSKTYKTHFHFLVQNEVEVALTETIIEKYHLTDTTLHPYYTKSNLSFFEKAVFLNNEDIFSDVIPQRIIFCNQALNYLNFGKLTILANGETMANTMNPSLGNIHDCSLLEMIYKELDTNTAWRKTRSEKPCCDCLYRYLCPPPSAYESVIGRYNLCEINTI